METLDMILLALTFVPIFGTIWLANRLDRQVAEDDVTNWPQ